MSPAERVPGLMRAAEKHYAEHRYDDAAYTLELAAVAAREAAQLERRHQRTVVIAAVPRLTVIEGGGHGR